MLELRSVKIRGRKARSQALRTCSYGLGRGWCKRHYDHWSCGSGRDGYIHHDHNIVTVVSITVTGITRILVTNVEGTLTGIRAIVFTVVTETVN